MKCQAEEMQMPRTEEWRVDRRVKLQVQGEQIPSIVGNLIKCLGKWFNESIIYKVSIEGTKKPHSWLRAVDGNGLRGKHKAWIY